MEKNQCYFRVKCKSKKITTLVNYEDVNEFKVRVYNVLLVFFYIYYLGMC